MESLLTLQSRRLEDQRCDLPRDLDSPRDPASRDHEPRDYTLRHSPRGHRHRGDIRPRGGGLRHQQPPHVAGPSTPQVLKKRDELA